MKALKSIMLAAVALTSITPAMAQQGPVASACKDDIAAHCAGKSHQNREVRNCLEANKSKVSDACKSALESTGPGKGMGRGMGGMGGMGGMSGQGK